MKKVLVFLVIGFVFFGACFAQNTNAQSSNDEQRIVGTWRTTVTKSDATLTLTYTFNSNGTFVSSEIGTGRWSENDKYNKNGSYFVSGSKLITTLDSFLVDGMSDFYLSSNGRILAYNGFWFEKQ